MEQYGILEGHLLDFCYEGDSEFSVIIHGGDRCQLDCNHAIKGYACEPTVIRFYEDDSSDEAAAPPANTETHKQHTSVVDRRGSNKGVPADHVQLQAPDITEQADELLTFYVYLSPTLKFSKLHVSFDVAPFLEHLKSGLWMLRSVCGEWKVRLTISKPCGTTSL